MTRAPHGKRICLCCLLKYDDRRKFVAFLEGEVDAVEVIEPITPPPAVELQ